MSSVLEADGLYAIPPSEFIAARDALAKQLRSQGRRDDAAVVKVLRRPAILAWALNQLSRRKHPAVQVMLDASDKLVAAHRRVLGGAPAQLLREATDVRTLAIAEIRAAVSDLLDETEQPSNKLEAVSEMMKAIATDSEAREAFASGRLTELIIATDFSELAGIGSVPDLPTEAVELPIEPDVQDSSAVREAEMEAASAEVERAGRRAADAARAVMVADSEAQRARTRVDNARDSLASALAAADKADETLAAAQDAAELARTALKEAEQGAEELRRSVDVS